MLIVKINPPAIKVIEVSPFNSTTVNLDYMTAVARPYVPGASPTNFQIQFGSVNFDENNKATSFNNEISSQLSMTSQDLESWGTNDIVLLQLIAAKLNVSILETIDVPGGNF